jgi:hypothetical protein
MGIVSSVAGSVASKGSKHFAKPYKAMKTAHQQMGSAQTAAQQKQLRKLRNQHFKRLARNTAIAGGVVGTAGAGYIGYKAAKGTVNAAKSVGRGIISQGSGAGYDVFIVAMLFMYLFLTPIYRANFQTTLMFHAAIILFVIFAVLRDSDKNFETYTIMGMILVIEVVLPTFIYRVDFLLQNKWVVNYLVNPQITLLWFYFGVFKSGRASPISKIAYILVWLFWFGIGFSFAMTTFDYEDISTVVTPDQIASAENLYIKTFKWWGDVIINFKDVMEQGRQYFNNRLRMATGDYYTGTVDENQHQRLGVFLDGLKASDPEFYQGETVSVWAMLEAKTLEDGLKIDINCYHGKKNSDGIFLDAQKGEPFPKTIPVVYDEEQVDIDCRFYNNDGQNDGSLEKGSNKVTVEAAFHFETMAYLKTYFMDKDSLRSMERQNIDPFEKYGIEDKKPTAKFTNGPVKIGMGSIDPPIGINDAYSVQPRLGITLDTNLGWKGKIKQIEELFVLVPNATSLDTDFCTEFEEVKQEDYEKNCQDNYKKYRSRQLFECVESEEVGLDKEINIDDNGELIKATPSQQIDFDRCLQKYCEKELGGYNAYQLIINENTKKFYTNIGIDNPEKQHKTFSCRVNLDKPANLLGNSPIAIQYFKVKARYTYVIEESTNVIIKESEVVGPEIQEPKYVDDRNVPYVFNKWGEEINNACTTGFINNNDLIKDKEHCVCFIGAIINVESNGREKITSEKKAKGLMQVMSGTAEYMVNKYALPSNYDLYTAKDNILFGTTYLQHLMNDKYTEGNLDYVMAAYNGGTCGYDKTKGYYNGALCDETDNPTFSCAGQEIKFYQCTHPNLDGYIETRNYVVKVNANLDACLNLDLVEYGGIKEEKNKDDFLNTNSGTVKLNEIIKFDNKFELEFKEDRNINEYHIEDESGYNIDLYYNGIKIDNMRIENVFPNQLYSFDDYPFIILRFTDKTTFEMLSWKNSIINSVNLVEDEEIPTANGGTNHKLSPVWKIDEKTLIYAYNNGGDIELYDQFEKKFCTIPWERDAVYRFCKEDEIINFYAINIETTTKEINGKGPYIKAQFIYDPALENTCCDNCNGCSSIQCTTCNDCTYSGGSYNSGTCYSKT